MSARERVGAAASAAAATAAEPEHAQQEQQDLFARAVILTTGGFGANRTLIAESNPHIGTSDFLFLLMPHACPRVVLFFKMDCLRFWSYRCFAVSVHCFVAFFFFFFSPRSSSKFVVLAHP